MNELAKIVQTSGLEKEEGQSIVDKFGNYESIAKEWEIKAKAIVVTDEKQTIEMAMAREARKKFTQLRIDVEKSRKAMKEQSLRKGQAIDAIAKFLQSLITPIEEHLRLQEDFIKIQEAQKADEARIEAERIAEAERIEKERKLKLHNERKDQLIPFWIFLKGDQRFIDFGELPDKEFAIILREVKAAQKADTQKRLLQEKQNALLKRQAQEKERQMQKERAEAEAKQKAMQAKADAERKALEEKAQKEAQEKEKLQQQILEAEKRERLEKERAEKEKEKALQAPDKVKALLYLDSLLDIERPEIQTESIQAYINNVIMLLTDIREDIISTK